MCILETNAVSVALFEKLRFQIMKHVKVLGEVEMQWKQCLAYCKSLFSTDHFWVQFRFQWQWVTLCNAISIQQINDTSAELCCTQPHAPFA